MVYSPRKKKLRTPLVSVIIPCYNGEKTVAQAIESVLWQTNKRWECIVVDDGSTDGSSSLITSLARMERRVKYVRQNNRGLATARNRGITLAKGAFIQFLDADDILLPDKLQLCLERFEAEPSLQTVYCDYALLSGTDHFFQTLPAELPGSDPVRSFLFEWNVSFIIPVHAFLFRRDVLERHRFEPGLHSHAEDIDCWIRIAAAGTKMAYVDSVGVIYRTSEASSTGNELALISAKLAVLTKYENKREFQRYAADFAEGRSYLHRRLAIAHFMRREFAQGLRLMRQEWNKSNAVWKIKMVGWLLLLLVFSKSFVIQLRERIISRTMFRWGGWKLYRTWEPPTNVRSIVTHLPR